MTDLVSVIMIFSIPLVAIVTSHRRSQSKIQHKIVKEQIELEKLKQENYLLETEKMKMELGYTRPLEEKEEVLTFLKQEKQEI
ncbi:hypothetical protein [Domibacillus enclensis]|uniref:Cell division protein FtsL n=1 Tax=Domibacillus enclensis TaxID=1017273 RepID=A0A1N6UDB6_9BACI|nr:hypothetical protein [Domibacillus enclensis]OXS78497.1 hypothetical protein B1B05_07810 [Domibacillus enclensis]SIQ63580.1 hypothetical protein SAMN05443094_103241 [Domibacillus enclensis]